MTFDSDYVLLGRRSFEIRKEMHFTAEGMQMHQQDSFVRSTGRLVCVNLIVHLMRGGRGQQF